MTCNKCNASIALVAFEGGLCRSCFARANNITHKPQVTAKEALKAAKRKKKPNGRSMRKAEWRDDKIHKANCTYCGGEFYTAYKFQKYCSIECRNNFFNAKNRNKIRVESGLPATPDKENFHQHVVYHDGLWKVMNRGNARKYDHRNWNSFEDARCYPTRNRAEYAIRVCSKGVAMRRYSTEAETLEKYEELNK